MTLTSHKIVHQYLSAAVARRDLSWKPTFSLEEGLVRTVAWDREIFASPRVAA